MRVLAYLYVIVSKSLCKFKSLYILSSLNVNMSRCALIGDSICESV